MNVRAQIRIFIALLSFLACQAQAGIRLPDLFASGMVIQRETTARVWGWADAGEKITVEGSWGKSAETTAEEDGRWMVRLPTPKAGGPYTITITGNSTVQIENVLSGEIWLCSGQSNMEWTLEKCSKTNPARTEEEHEPAAAYIKKEMETAQDDLFRQFSVMKNTSPFEPLDTMQGDWKASSPQHNPDFSATAYFFGRELRKELGVPVGLIKCAWGGTRVEAWMPEEQFQHDEYMADYFEREQADLKDMIAQWSPEQAEADYQAALKRWEQTKKGRKPRMAGLPGGNQHTPSTLFNAMVHPLIPYAIRGAIWYQGESNTKHNTEHYERNLAAMISGWRAQWGLGSFPFYITQLANFQASVPEPLEYDGWASICDQQRRTLALENTGMAVLNDIGEAKDVHPHNKVDAGKRLALWALKKDYGKNVTAWSGPLYRKHTIKGSKVIITFDHAGSGLMTGHKHGLEATKETDEPLRRFQVCGDDRAWKWAEAEITGKDEVTVSHVDIQNPMAVRYAWAANPEGANLYNREGLPASVFTTEAEVPVMPGPESGPGSDQDQGENASAKESASPSAGSSQLVRNLKEGRKQVVVTFGTSLSKVGAWVDQLHTVLEQQYPGQASVINGAQGGSNSEWGRESLDEKVLPHNPDTVFIEFAMNDANARRNTSVAQARENLENIIGRILEQNPACEIILMVMNPTVGQPRNERPHLEDYYQMYRDVAAERGFLLIDHCPNWNRVLEEDPARFMAYMPDGIHPVREGALAVITPAITDALGLDPGRPEESTDEPCWKYILNMADQDKDREVTRDEFDGFWADAFLRTDTDQDGRLDENELVTRVLFDHLDRNRDQRVDLEEYQAMYAPLFQQRDADGDGVLARDEISKP